MSAGVADKFLLSFNFMIPALSSKINARPPLVGSFYFFRIQCHWL